MRAAVRSGPWLPRLARRPCREAGYALQRNTLPGGLVGAVPHGSRSGLVVLLDSPARRGGPRLARQEGCVDASLRRLPIWSADQSRHCMWHTGRPHSLLWTVQGCGSSWTGQLRVGPRHLASTHDDPKPLCQPVAAEPNGARRVISDQPDLYRVEICPKHTTGETGQSA
jgi:hypothetical protein